MTTRTADAAHEPDRMPSDEEEKLAQDAAEALESSGKERSVAEHYDAMARRGVDQKGEGRID